MTHLYPEQKSIIEKLKKNSSKFWMKMTFRGTWTGKPVPRERSAVPWLKTEFLYDVFCTVNCPRIFYQNYRETLKWDSLNGKCHYKTYFRRNTESQKCFIIEFSIDWQYFIIEFFDRKFRSQANCFISGFPVYWKSRKLSEDSRTKIT